MANDKLAGWIVITRMLLPFVLVCLTIIYAFLKLLCCLICSKKAVKAEEPKSKAE